MLVKKRKTHHSLKNNEKVALKLAEAEIERTEEEYQGLVFIYGPIVNDLFEYKKGEIRECTDKEYANLINNEWDNIKKLL